MGNKASSGSGSGKEAHATSVESTHAQSPTQAARKSSYRASSRTPSDGIDLRFCIRGAPGTGKTTLVDRLSGKHFNPAYTPTPDTRVITQRLTFKLADEMNVAIYDCVDDGTGTMLDRPADSYYDVCEVVAFLVDPRDRSSLDFVKRELPRVPHESDILVMINFKDLVTKDPSLYAIIPEDLRELAGMADGRSLTTFEVCLKDCYGLKTLQTIMNRPFITAQMKQLRKDLEDLQAQLEGTQQEIQTYISSTNYDKYLEWLNAMQVPSGDDPKLGRASSGMAGLTSGSQLSKTNEKVKKSRRSMGFFGRSTSPKSSQKDPTQKGIRRNTLKTSESQGKGPGRDRVRKDADEAVPKKRNPADYMLRDDRGTNSEDDDGDFFDDDHGNLDSFYGSDDDDGFVVKQRTDGFAKDSQHESRKHKKKAKAHQQDVDAVVNPEQGVIDDSFFNVSNGYDNDDDNDNVNEEEKEEGDDNTTSQTKERVDFLPQPAKRNNDSKDTPERSGLSRAAKAAIEAAKASQRQGILYTSSEKENGEEVAPENANTNLQSAEQDMSEHVHAQGNEEDKKKKKKKKKKQKKQKKQKKNKAMYGDSVLASSDDDVGDL